MALPETVTRNWLSVCGALLAGIALSIGPAQGVNVTTYHYDNYRTGWNPAEQTLNPTAVASTSFGWLHSTSLDDLVNAQPLFMTGQRISGQGVHDVVYVATEGDTVYAIDATTGQILLSRNFGIPVPQSALPGYCGNNGPHVGIESTPVIDGNSKTLYLIAYHLNAQNKPTYHLHVVSLRTLKDVTTPVTIRASGVLSDGRLYSFHPGASRQRPALLLASGKIYAGFGSFCDLDANISRGWVLGWNSATLAPLANNELTNRLVQDQHNFFLSSVWMSGYGLAAGGPNGDIYFVTGNSDRSGNTIDGVNNIAESVVQLSSDLSQVKGVFTPFNAANVLEKYDADFGSGGAMLLPPQNGQPFGLMVAAGKDGKLFLLNADNVGSDTSGKGLGYYGIGGCWCGESYFKGSDGIGRVVASGGTNVNTFKVITAPSPKLSALWTSDSVIGTQDPGFFTSISTNGAAAGSGVIWAVGRPDGTANQYVRLYAFNADTGATLFSGTAGTWPYPDSNANIVPVVANGKVYVASRQQLAIFGLGAPAHTGLVSHLKPPAPAPLAAGEHELYGTVMRVANNAATIKTRNGTVLAVDLSPAAKAYKLATPSVGHGVLVRGAFNSAGVFVASSALHAKDNPASWRSDR